MGRSYTEAEFDAAIDSGIPILAFVATNKKLFRREDVDTLDAEITRLRRKVTDAQKSAGFMLQEFASWEQFNVTLQAALDAHLPGVVAATPVTPSAPVENLILPRADYPVFDGMDRETLYGRTVELEKLDHWLADAAQSGLMIRAIGGMGKTSLAWRWLDTLSETLESAPISGIFWFSFYAGDHSLRLFARKLRGWLEPHVAPRRRQVIGPEDSDWTAVEHYLEGLKHKPLVILDGLEAEFVGYIGRKPAAASDLGASFGEASRAYATEESHDVLHDFAQFRDTAGGANLVDFIQSNLAKILITTREIPTAFVRLSRGQERLIGKLDEIILEELAPTSARELLDDFGVKATEKTLKALLASPVIRHPLILTMFANCVLCDDIALGNLDAYIARYPDQNILEFAIQRRTHILFYVFDDLTDCERFVLDIITVSDIAMPRDFIEAAALRKGYSQDAVSYALDHLRRKRGLIHSARRMAPDEGHRETFYSMHPVCRGYWTNTNLKSLKESAEFIDEDFEEHLFGGVGRGVVSPTVFDLEARVLVVTRVAIEAERYARAWKLFAPFRNNYHKYGLYGQHLEFVLFFLRFGLKDGTLVAETPIEEIAEAEEVFRCGADILRLFGQNDRAIACADALIALVRNRLSTDAAVSSAKLGTNERSELDAEWGRLLCTLPVLDYRERHIALCDLWARFKAIGYDPNAHALSGQFLTESIKYFGAELNSDLIPFNEFLLTISSLYPGHILLSWNLFVRFKHMSSAGWTEETVLDTIDALFRDGDSRELRVALFLLLEAFLDRGQLKRAQQLQERLDGMEGWAQLDLNETLQQFQISLALEVAEHIEGVPPESIEEIQSSIDTYIMHFQDRFCRGHRCWIAVARLRLAVLSGSNDAFSLLEAAVAECFDLALPRDNRLVKDVLRCAGILERREIVDRIEAELPRRYDLPWKMPDPFFGFSPNPRLCGVRPWKDAARDGST